MSQSSTKFTPPAGPCCSYPADIRQVPEEPFLLGSGEPYPLPQPQKDHEEPPELLGAWPSAELTGGSCWHRLWDTLVILSPQMAEDNGLGS